MKRYFAVDLGAESGRCITGVIKNGVLETEELSRFPTGGLSVKGSLRWNIYRFYEEIINGLKEYVRRYGRSLYSIGVDSWGVDYSLIDQRGELVGLPYCYRDNRQEGMERLIEGKKEFVYQRTGIQFLKINTLNQLLAEKEKTPHNLEKCRGMMFVGDTLHYLLGAKPCCEYTGASISMLVNTKERQWDDDIFREFGLPERLKTPISYAGDIIGVLTDDIANLVGLDAGVKLITPAVHDTASAAVAIPSIGEEVAFISSGTWSIVGTELDYPINTQAAMELNISNSGGVLGKSLFLKNVMGLWIIQQCKVQWDKREKLSYDKIAQLASGAPPFTGFIDVDDDIFFSPNNMLEAVETYRKEHGGKGISTGDVGGLSRLIYENLAFKYRRCFEYIWQLTGQNPSVINITGGGGRNILLGQMVANVMDRPVHLGPDEGTAMGNILLQAYGGGELDSLEQIRRVVKNSTTITQLLPEDTKIWEEQYQAYLKHLEG